MPDFPPATPPSALSGYAEGQAAYASALSQKLGTDDRDDEARTKEVLTMYGRAAQQGVAGAAVALEELLAWLKDEEEGGELR